MASHVNSTAIKGNLDEMSCRHGSTKRKKQKMPLSPQQTHLPQIRRNKPKAKSILELLIQWSTAIQNLAERDFITFAIVLFQSIAVVAGIYTTLSPTASSTAISATTFEEDDGEWNESSKLIVCLPENSTNCVKYVNSTKNGLIVLNESIYPALKAFKEDFDYRLIARINPFWLKFEPPSDTYYNTMAALYMFIFFVGTSGNGLVIYMFARCKALRTSPYILVLNLAISDFLIVFKCPLAAFNNFMREPVLGDWGCRIYGFIGGLSGTASIGMLTIIALDRYSVVVDPLNPNRINYNTRYYAIWAIFVWLYALFFSSVPLAEIGLSRYVPEGYFTTCSFDYLDTSLKARVFMFVFFLCAWLIPLSVICFCYFHILNVVFNARECIQSNKSKQNIEIRLAIVVLLIILQWFLAWTPYSIVAICGIFEHEEYLTPSRAMIPALFCKSASCLNPFLYTISHKRFRHELQRLFCNRKPIMHYSTTRSSYMTKSSRRPRQVDPLKDTQEPRNSVRRHDAVAGYYQQRQYTFKRNVRSASTPDGTGIGANESVQYGRSTTNRSSIVPERSMAQYGNSRTAARRKSLITGHEGSGVFVIDTRPSTAPEDDVIFIVSGRRSSLTQSISTQVFVISNDKEAPDIGGPSPPKTHLETSF